MEKGAVLTANPEEKATEAGLRFAEWKDRRKEYEKHEVYYIEDNEEVLFIPGSHKLLRRKCVYDQTSKILLAIPPSDPGKNVERIESPEAMKKLDESIRHPIRSLNENIFIRRLRPSSPADRYYGLLEVMHGHEIPRRIDLKTQKEESEERYQKRKQQYLNMIFDLVISQG